jgi:hypothetical protein
MSNTVIDNIVYTVVSGNASVTGFTQENPPIFVNILNSVIINSISYNVTSIGDFAFYNCRSLTSITIPNSVISIGNYAFNYCTRLTSIEIPDGVTSIGNYAFASCTSLTSITIPNSVTSIANGIFESCTSLTSITIPNGVRSIGNYAFAFCTRLTSITIPDGVSVTSIGNSAFYNCRSLTSITIPDGVSSIGTNAFQLCTSLTSIAVPGGVSSVGAGAFRLCTSLTTVIVANPSLITTVNTNSFQNVSGNTDSIISFLFTESYSDLSNTWKTISTYYATQQYYIAKIPTSITGVPETQTKTYGEVPFVLTYSSNNPTTPSYSSSNEAVATINSLGLVTILSLGETTLTVSLQENSYYTAGSVMCELSVTQIPTSITGVPETQTKTYGDEPFYLTYSSNNQSTPSYSSSNEAVATINSSGLVTILSSGQTTLTISLQENSYYTAGSATSLLTVNSNNSSNPVEISTTDGFEYFLTNTNAVYCQISVPTLQVTNLVNQGDEPKQITSIQKCIIYKQN